MDNELHQLALELQEAVDNLRHADSKNDEIGVYRIKKELTDLLEQFGFTVRKVKDIYCIEKLVGASAKASIKKS